jgi:hypothetical protein
MGVLGLVACGKSASHDDDESTGGGTSGSAGTAAGVSGASQGGASQGGASQGGAIATGGRGGTTGGRGGSVSAGGSPGAAGAEAGTGGDAGGGEGPSCTLAGGVSCSFDAACEVLGCGRAWSSYDDAMCVRENCAETGVCAPGKRCVTSPVGGRFDEICRNEADSCDPSGDRCECLYYEECFPSAVCLSDEEFPTSDECPIANLDCTELSQATETVDAYLHGDGFLEPYEPPPNLAASLNACAQAVAERFALHCEE